MRTESSHAVICFADGVEPRTYPFQSDEQARTFYKKMTNNTSWKEVWHCRVQESHCKDDINELIEELQRDSEIQ